MIFFEIGRITESKACYEKAIEINPCYQREDLAVETIKFLENRTYSLEKLHKYLELASSTSWESSDPTPPLSQIIRILNKNLTD